MEKMEAVTMKNVRLTQQAAPVPQNYVSVARVCYLHYVKGMTQSAIADLLGIGRPRVSRLLQKGVEDGTVKFDITFAGYFPEIEQDLQKTYRGVKFVVAEPLDGTFEETRYSISRTAADFLDVILKPGERVAVGMGTTLRETAEHLTAELEGTEFVAMVGGRRGVGLDIHANSVVEQLSRNTGGVAVEMFSPALAGSDKECEALKGLPLIKETLRMAASANTCIFSIEDPSSSASTLSLAGYHTEQDVVDLRANDVVCDVMSIGFYNRQAERVATEISNRAVSISEAEFRAIPRKVCLAGGDRKHESISVALDAGLIDVLVTDAYTGEYLLGRRE